MHSDDLTAASRVAGRSFSVYARLRDRIPVRSGRAIPIRWSSLSVLLSPFPVILVLNTPCQHFCASIQRCTERISASITLGPQLASRRVLD